MPRSHYARNELVSRVEREAAMIKRSAALMPRSALPLACGSLLYESIRPSNTHRLRAMRSLR
jgi:hypothetical protein